MLNLGAGTALLLAGGELRSGTIALACGTLLATTGRIDLDQAGNRRDGAERRIVADGTLTPRAATASYSKVGSTSANTSWWRWPPARRCSVRRPPLDYDGMLAAVNSWHLRPGRTLDSMGNTRIFGSLITTAALAARATRWRS